MRLIDTATLALHEFFDGGIPRYAILSHRWEAEEVSFQEMLAGKGPTMKGWSKISGCCLQAALHGYSYVWVDSCCIDKTSSAELSEAINSMYRWYERSQVCYVYLSDVGSVTGINDDTHYSKASGFRRSKWFTRGWTLQELLAPRRVIFYDSTWQDIGTKVSMEKLISEITGIKSQHLRDHRSASVAQRMSWASERQTTRIEDRAYSLLGLFDVNIPPLYGEGMKAFRRLQLEILATSDDESIFAWQQTRGIPVILEPIGMLAGYPQEFRGCRNVVRYNSSSTRSAYHMTNKGLLIESFLIPTHGAEHDSYIIPICCAIEGHEGQLGISVVDERLISQKGTDKRQSLDMLTLRRRNKNPIIIKYQGERPSQKITVYVMDPANWPQVPHEVIFSSSRVILDEMTTESLGHHNFSVFQQQSRRSGGPIVAAVRNVLHRSDTSREQFQRMIFGWPEHFSEVQLHFVEGAYIVDDQMKADSDTPDTFVLVLDTTRFSSKPLGVDLQVPRICRTVEGFVTPLPDMISKPEHLTDRISRVISSGTTVSASIRPSAADPSECVLDIRFDRSGKLLWPDALDNMGNKAGLGEIESELSQTQERD